jgi:hypothetical protein
LNNRIHEICNIDEFFSLTRFHSNRFPHNFCLPNATTP